MEQYNVQDLLTIKDVHTLVMMATNLLVIEKENVKFLLGGLGTLQSVAVCRFLIVLITFYSDTVIFAANTYHPKVTCILTVIKTL